MSTDEPFQMDGEDHERGPDCFCGPKPCPRCGAWVHYQGVYGGLAELCEACEYPFPVGSLTPSGE